MTNKLHPILFTLDNLENIINSLNEYFDGEGQRVQSEDSLEYLLADSKEWFKSIKQIVRENQ